MKGTQKDKASPTVNQRNACRHHRPQCRQSAVALDVIENYQSDDRSWMGWTVLDVGDLDLQTKLDPRSQCLLPCPVQFCPTILDAMEMKYGVMHAPTT